MRTLTLTIITALTIGNAVPAAGHNSAARADWLEAWELELERTGGLTADLLYELFDFLDRHDLRGEAAVVVIPPAPRSRAPVAAGVEQWRDLVSVSFPAETVEAALRVMQCESRGDPNAYNPSSGASGLFQHLARYWPDRSAKAGVAGADVFDPEANIIVAAWLSAGGSDWSHWVCKP